jgi:hypothetical protein
MNSLEKAVLQNLRKTLVDSTNTKWEVGYFDDWNKWAREMKTTILNSVSTMDALLNEPTTTEKEPEKEPEPDKN